MKPYFAELRFRFLFLILVLAMGAAGCSPVATVKRQSRNLARALPFTGGELRKRVVVVPFENRTFLSGSDLDQLVFEPFTVFLRDECPDLIWITPGDPDYPAEMNRLPRLITGAIDSLALAETGRRLGFNAVVTGSFDRMEAEEKEKGLIFEETYYAGTVILNPVIYNMVTGAKLMDDIVARRGEIDGAAFDAIRQQQSAGIMAMSEMMGKAAEKAGNRVCTAVKRLPWQAYVTAVEEGKIILSHGRETGVQPGDVLSVYDIGGVIGREEGQKFILPGQKTGEIEVTEVFAGKAEASPRGEFTIEPGYSVRKP